MSAQYECDMYGGDIPPARRLECRLSDMFMSARTDGDGGKMWLLEMQRHCEHVT
jgi:hypothetical protein